MNKILPISLMFVSCATWGSGKVVTQNRELPAFRGVSVGGGFEVVLHRGGKQQVIVKADDNIIGNITTKVVDGVLEVGMKRNWNGIGDATLELDITVPELTGVEASGGVEMSGDGPKGNECKIEASGGVHMNLRGIACEKISLEASGGANLKLVGAAKQMEMEASGGVDLKAADLKVAEAKLDASGGVSGTIAVSELIDASFSGGVTLKVKGRPRVKRFDTSGGVDSSFED